MALRYDCDVTCVLLTYCIKADILKLVNLFPFLNFGSPNDANNKKISSSLYFTGWAVGL